MWLKILVINHKRLWYISINLFKHRWCNFEVIHTFVPKSKMYSLCWEHCSAIERSLLKWNGRDCNSSTIMQLGFTVVTWQHSEIWLVLPTFWQWKWTCGSCQAVFPVAWKQGYISLNIHYSHVTKSCKVIGPYCHSLVSEPEPWKIQKEDQGVAGVEEYRAEFVLIGSYPLSHQQIPLFPFSLNNTSVVQLVY